MHKRISTVQGPHVGETWLHTTDLFSRMPKNVDMKVLDDTLTRWDKHSVHFSFVTQKTNIHAFLGWVELEDLHCVLFHFAVSSY
jgi:hypothetical protein